jgi:hypothetical protein
MPKVLFHDEYISTQNIPTVLLADDITTEALRNFRSTYEWTNIDISNTPFNIDLDTTQDFLIDMLMSDFTLTSNIDTGSNSIHFITSNVTDIKKGDYILIKNDVYNEIFKITDINISQNTYSVSREYKKYEFLSSDDTIKAYWCKRIMFQPILLTFGEHLVNYPVLFNLHVKYLNI